MTTEPVKDTETTKPVETEMIPKSELATLRAKAVEHDRYGGQRRILEDEKKAVAATLAELKKEREEWQKEQDRKELEAADGDPDGTKAIQRRQAARIDKAELARLRKEAEEREGQSKEDREKLAKLTKEQNAREVATRFNVNPESLIKFTDGSVEAMEDLAKELPKIGGKQPLKSDSGATVGGQLTEQDRLDARYPTMQKK